MIWTNETHDCAATHCPKLGRPCPAAMRMLKALSASMTQAKGVTEDNFQMTGQAGLNACAEGCMARFVASHYRIRVFCGVSITADQSDLDRFADVMLCDASPGPKGLGNLPIRPRALAQAVPQRPPVATTIARHLAAVDPT
ncbi:hypothetical protein KMP13_16045 [Epibacterium ulvae]|uniref:hypothetical protein n=1 Tax=Epibacterium ulvae TaxID=1156985 RepID=UPI001BFCB3CB|nr:hypothetical protein [Epibacterium ulvae]MBT8155352.1 hypothetical protein [Epibacterium ulvae]